MANLQTVGRTKRGTFAPGFTGNPKGIRRDHAEPVDQRVDGWASAFSGIGTIENDKRTSHYFVSASLTYEQAVELWRGDDMACRAIETVPNECFRQGYEITIADEGNFEDLKEEMEERMLELEVDAKVKKAMCTARALGGSAILLGINDHRAMNLPLNRNKVSKLEWLNVLEPREIEPASYYNNPLGEKYGQPEYYRLTGLRPADTYVGNVKQTKVIDIRKLIHESRLIVFSGVKVSRYQSTNGVSGMLWGDSILTRMLEVLRDFNISMHAAGIIVTDFSQAIFAIKNLMTIVARDEDKLRDRMRALEMGRSVARAVLIDTEESFTRQSTNTTGLPELLHTLSKRLAAAIGIPLSVLMNDGPASEDSSDVRFFYDMVQGYQREHVGPIIKMLAKMVMQGLRQRKLPKKWGIRFNPLWRLTDEEQAEARLAQARVDAIYIKHGVLDPNTVALLRFGGEYSFDTALSPGYKAPGFVTLPPTGVGPEEKTKLTTPKGVGATAHAVKPYTRSNPKGSGGTNNAATADPQGGGTSTVGSRDSAESDDDDAG